MVKLSSVLGRAVRPGARQQAMLEAGGDRSATRAREDYVKAIYQLGAAGPVRAADVARHLEVSAVAVSKAKRHLERDGFLEPGLAGGNLVLTARGAELAVKMIGRHRLVETFLHRALGVPLERIHAEAERIEHVISDDIAERLAALLGHPASDPHGHPIPYATSLRDDVVPQLPSVALGATIRVASLDDRDPEIVRALADAGILPGLEAEVSATSDDAVRLRWQAHETTLTAAQAATVRVATLEERAGPGTLVKS